MKPALYLLALAIGCAPAPKMTGKNYDHRLLHAAEVLKAEDVFFLEAEDMSPPRYAVSMDSYMRLVALVNVYEGRAKVTKLVEGYKVEEYHDVESIDGDILLEADADGDSIITSDEANAVLFGACEEYLSE